jgi:four helix bundle protein
LQDFQNLAIWKKAHALSLAVYENTRRFPREEVYGLRSQIRRAASSIGANIAEGCGRRGDLEFSRFLSISMGSASELQYLLLLSRDLKFLTNDAYDDLSTKLTEIKKMTSSLDRRLRADS